MPDRAAVEACLSVGSNISPEANVPAALRLLIAAERVTGVSTMYRTDPLARPEQPPFINGVWRIKTHRDARCLKYEVLRGIEQALGRVRTADAYAPRTIDLDILLYGDAVISEGGLVIPDPDILDRPFLAIPLVELQPDLRLPGTGPALAEHPICARTDGMTPLPQLTQLLKEISNL